MSKTIDAGTVTANRKDQATEAALRSSEDREDDPPGYWSTWCYPDRFVANGIETMNELIATLKATVKELKQGIKELEAMRDDGVIVTGHETMPKCFILEAASPDVVEKYGFDPVEY